MTTTLKAQFDGKVFVPEGAVDVPAGVTLTLTVERAATQPMTMTELNAWVRANPPDRDAVNELQKFINCEFSKVDARDW